MAWVEKHRHSWLVREWKDGKKITLRTFSTFEDAEAEAQYFAKHGKIRAFTMSESIDRLQRGMVRPRDKRFGPTLARYAYDSIESDPNIGDTSRDAYLSTIRNHVEGSILDVPLKKIVDEPDLVRKFYANLRPLKDYSAGGKGMKASVHRLLTKVFNQAVRDGVIPSSPMSRAAIKRPSKKRSVEVEPLTVDQVEALAAACLSERDRLMILVAGYCGLRGGEVGGLRVKDVNAKTCEFHIRQAVKGTGAKKHLGLPKGEKARLITSQ